MPPPCRDEIEVVRRQKPTVHEHKVELQAVVYTGSRSTARRRASFFTMNVCPKS
jgi:hypothetical protein